MDGWMEMCVCVYVCMHIYMYGIDGWMDVDVCKLM